MTARNATDLKGNALMTTKFQQTYSTTATTNQQYYQKLTMSQRNNFGVKVSGNVT